MHALSSCEGPIESNFNSIQSPLSVLSWAMYGYGYLTTFSIEYMTII